VGQVLEIAERLRLFDQRIRAYDLRIERVFQHDEGCQRLAAVQGVGPLVSSAMVAAVGNAREFKSGRKLSVWLGLVPRQYSSGNRSMPLGISKRGDHYLLIHGARAALRCAERGRDPHSRWVTQLKLRRGANAATVALANNNARIIWALLTRGDQYRPAIPDQSSMARPTAHRPSPTAPIRSAGAEGSLHSEFKRTRGTTSRHGRSFCR
jgi:transposase